MRAWSETGPFPWQGEHYDLQFVNPWPRPLQKPHPPIWLPGTGAVELIETAAERRYPFVMVLAAQWFTKAAFDTYRETAHYDVDPSQLGAAIPTYVGDSDDSAHREAKRNAWFTPARPFSIEGALPRNRLESVTRN